MEDKCGAHDRNNAIYTQGGHKYIFHRNIVAEIRYDDYYLKVTIKNSTFVHDIERIVEEINQEFEGDCKTERVFEYSPFD